VNRISSSKVHERLEARVRMEGLFLLEIQSKGIHVNFEQEARINLIYIFWILIWHLPWKEIPENEVTIHNGVEIINFDTVLIDDRFLVMTKEARKPSNNSLARGASSLFFTLESPEA